MSRAAAAREEAQVGRELSKKGKAREFRDDVTRFAGKAAGARSNTELLRLGSVVLAVRFAKASELTEVCTNRRVNAHYVECSSSR